MTAEMSPRERLEAVIRLELPDRVPVGGHFDAFCANVTGITLEEWVFDPDKAEKAFFGALDMLGGCDLIQRAPRAGSPAYDMAQPSRIKLPGRDLPPNTMWQVEETEVMTVEDYDFVIREGFEALQDVVWRRVGTVVDKQQLAQSGARFRQNTERCRNAGIEPISGGNLHMPYGFFCQARSLNSFLIDLYRFPEKVLAASDACIDSMIAKAIQAAQTSPIRRLGFWQSRASTDFVSPRISEKFFFPYMKKAARALIEAEITPIIHLDNNWTSVLHHLLDLPRGKCLVQLDGFTDIFKAKQLLGNHTAIMGDVPPALLTLGTPEEVTAYCRKLIEVVGRDGGFVLGAGCNVPGNAKLENVRAMIDTAKKHGWYGRH